MLPPVTTPTDTHESMLPDLRRMADEIRVRIHLAGLEAKDAWAKLEPKLHELEHKATSAGERVKDQLSELAQKLKHELQELSAKVTGDDATRRDTQP